MKFNRQHILLGVLGVIGLANVGDWVLNSAIQGPLKERRDRAAALQEGIEKRQALLKETRKAGKKIADWKKRSLPANTEVARSLYRSWLHGHVTECGLSKATVDSGSPSSRRGLYTTLPFSVRGRGTLNQFTNLMFCVTDAGHLHRVKDISLTPGGNGVFDISFNIEALIVAGTKQTDRLARVKGNVLASTQAGDYAIISRQNLFGIGYRDPLASASVTAITWKNGKPRVWISDEGSDTVLKVGLNEEVVIDTFRGKIVSATDEEVTIESGSNRLVIALGSSFADALVVEP
ncbi:MAG: hypothetical protein AB8G99_10930 [Planctomycetaceae bacterium]